MWGYKLPTYKVSLRACHNVENIYKRETFV